MTLTGDYIIGYCIVAFISIVAYFSFMQPDIFSGKKVIPYIKYRKNGMLESFALEMKLQLEDLMKKEKVYLDHTLTLDKLADLLNLSRHHTSQIINEYFKWRDLKAYQKESPFHKEWLIFIKKWRK